METRFKRQRDTPDKGKIMSTMPILYKYINYDAKIVRTIMASYNRELLKKGYRGKFVIQSHKAEKAGSHWDIRLEFPVTSLKKALRGYTVERPDTDGLVEEEYPDKPGTVLRSFVNKKMELPIANKKIFLVETEDHPIEYGTFKGEIEKGYGTGTVDIWDKGTYELLDIEGDNKYVVNFKGKKLNGIYAFIKYQNGYLWIKTKEKKASAIDYVRPTLPPQLWHLDKDPPILRDEVRNTIIETFIKTYTGAGLNLPLQWIKKLVITGSATSNNYKENGDVDIDIIYDAGIIRKTYPGLNKLTDADLHEYLKNIIKPTTGKGIHGTSHSFSFMVLEPGENPISDAIYDIFKNKWIKKPILIPIDFDPDKAFIDQREIALSVAEQIDLVLGSIVRTIDDLKKVNQYDQYYGGMTKKRVILMHWLQKLCTILNNQYNWIWDLQKEAAREGEKAYYPALNLSPNWKEKMIVFKYLARYGYHRCVQMLYSLLKNDPYLEIIDQFIPDE